MSDLRAVVFAAVLAASGLAVSLSCSTRSGHAAAPASGAAGAGGAVRRPPDGGGAAKPKPDAGAELAAVAEGDCLAVCAKLLRCKHGPWDTEADCLEACEGAIEDDSASKTYRCAAKATSCAKLKRCGR